MQDVDCMPLRRLENKPASVARSSSAVNKLFENFTQLKINGREKDQRLEGYIKFSPGDTLENVRGPSHESLSSYPMDNLLKQTKVASVDANSQANTGLRKTAINQQTLHSQHHTLAEVQAKEADVQALTELTRPLNKKEAAVIELKHINDDVLESDKDGDCSLSNSEPFKKQYSAVLVQLNAANEQVSSALYCLRQRNSYQGNFPQARPRPMANLGDHGGLLSSLDHSTSHTQASGSSVNEVVESSRTKAQTMVDAVMQGMSSLKGVEKMETAIDHVNDRLLPLDDFCMLATDSVHVGLASHD
ncbi:unnamed protein product [Ilex paraguariensis]|uniref:Uncharacterized protein n=1 Tax=Ilex paraguariensis TaxID=185542 RepID=A0ABC8RKQ1_9AQUA